MADDVPHDNQAEDARPWERPGAVRRDREPHRGHWLRLLGQVAFSLSFFSFAFGLVGLIGLAAGGAIFWAARQDLAKMRAGQMDPEAWGQVALARHLAIAAVITSAAGGLTFACVFWALLRL